MTPSGMRGVPKEVSSIYFADAPPAGGFVARRDKLPYPFEDRGEQRVKNIARPVRVYALRRELSLICQRRAQVRGLISYPTVAPRLSILVLHFGSREGPRVRILLPPAASPVRT
jgi:hypothetical protein